LDSFSPEREAAVHSELERGVAPPTITPKHELRVTAMIERTRTGWMTLVGTVRAVTSDDLPQGTPSLTLRDSAGSPLWTRQLDSKDASKARPYVGFSEFLGKIEVQGGAPALLEVQWGGWIAQPTALTIPSRSTR
jgi:hypothetical protein